MPEIFILILSNRFLMNKNRIRYFLTKIPIWPKRLLSLFQYCQLLVGESVVIGLNIPFITFLDFIQILMYSIPETFEKKTRTIYLYQKHLKKKPEPFIYTRNIWKKNQNHLSIPETFEKKTRTIYLYQKHLKKKPEPFIYTRNIWKKTQNHLSIPETFEKKTRTIYLYQKHLKKKPPPPNPSFPLKKNYLRIKGAFEFINYWFFSHVNCIKHWEISYVWLFNIEWLFLWVNGNKIW